MNSERIYQLAGSLLAASPDINVHQALRLAVWIVKRFHRTEGYSDYEEAS